MTARAARLLVCTMVALGACAPDDPVVPSVPTESLTVDLSVGSADGQGPDVLGRVTGIAKTDDDLLAIADARLHEIKVFAPDGSYLYSVGREGAGPGELIGPCCLSVGPGGEVWVKEFGNGRYSVFSLGPAEGSFVRTVRLSHGDANLMAPITFSEAGGLVDVGHRPTSDGESVLSRIYHGPTGEELSHEPVTSGELAALSRFEVEIQVGEFRGVRYFYQPFGESHLVSHGPRGAWADAVSSEYRVRVRRGADQLEWVGPTTMGPALSAAEVEAGEERLRSIAEMAGRPVGGLPFELPDRKQIVRGLHFDRSGNVWVELHVADGEPRAADVWSPTGELSKRVTWPDDVELGFPGWIDEDQAFGIRRDDFDVPFVVRLVPQ